jgi:IgA peptidase M64
MSERDGRVIGTTILQDSGKRGFNLVIVSEGYKQAELPTFATDAKTFMDNFFLTPPFDSHQAWFNVHRVDVASTDSDAKDPAGACGGSGANPATYFDASFCWNNLPRLLGCDSALVRKVVNAQVPKWNGILVIVNSTTYGGSGGSVAVFSRAAGSAEIGIHELCHSAFGLADEYSTHDGCDSGEAGHDNYTGAEPAQPNVTANINRNTLKWGSFVAASTALPTTVNADCTKCDPQASPVATGTVGAFTGAFYNHCGAYRPEFDCKMRTLTKPFCSVCQTRIAVKLNPYAPLSDSPQPKPDTGVG